MAYGIGEKLGPLAQMFAGQTFGSYRALGYAAATRAVSNAT